jgi:hypothetical protein
MTKEDKNIRLSLFGFNKNEVDKYINNLEKQKVSQLEDLKESIAMVTAENKMWEKELEELKVLLHKQLEQQDFMEYALSKAETQINSLIIRGEENKSESTSIIDEKKDLKNTALDMKTFLEEQNFENDKLEKTDLNTTISVFESEKDFDNENAELIKDNINLMKDNQEEEIDKTSRELTEIDNGEVNLSTISAEKNDTNNEAESSNCHEENKDKIPTESNSVENKSLESKSIISERGKVRSKYLIGKIVGKDLFDKQGNLLFTKGSIITENLIKTVDKEGKLGELILNMELPQISE